MTGVQTSELAPDLIVLTAPPPIDDYRYATAILDVHGRYLLVNQSFAGLQGVGPDDLRGRSESDLVARTVATALAGNDRLALDSPTAILTEERVVDSVGRRRVVMCRCALLDADHKPHAVVRMYGSASARDRVIAEFHHLLDAVDPTGARTREFEAQRLGPNAGSPPTAASAAPRPDPAQAGRTPPRPDDRALRGATAAAEAERTARTAAEALLADERAARTIIETRLSGEQAGRLAVETELAEERAARLHAEAQLQAERDARAQTQAQLQAERDGRAQTEAQLGSGRALAGEREQNALRRVADLEATVAGEREARGRAETELEAEREARQSAEGLLEAEREARQQAKTKDASEAGEFATLEGRWAAEHATTESALAETRAALAETRAEARSLAARHQTLSAEHADTQAKLEETRRDLDLERATRESLAADLGSAGARSAAAETMIRAQAVAVEARLAAERKAREDAEKRVREVADQQAAERAAREQAEARARQLETQRTAETKMRQNAEANAREQEARRRDDEAEAAAERAGRAAREQSEAAARQRDEAEARKAANARVQELEAQNAVARGACQQAETRAQEMERRRAAEQQAREQAEARARELETQHAAERRARESAEARTHQLEAERLAARAGLDALRRRLDPGAPGDFTDEPDDLAFAPPPAPPPPAPPLLRVARDSAPTSPIRPGPPALGHGIPAPAPPPAGEPATPQARRSNGPSRRRSPAVYRPVAASADATFPALTNLLGSGRGPGAAKSLRAVLPAALSLIGESSGWDAVAMWQKGQASRPLTCLGIWTRQAHELDWFESISWHAKLELGDSPAGDIDAAGRLAWVPDLGTDGEDDSARERTARAADLASRVVVPLSSAKSIVGALEVLARDVRQPDDVSVARLTTCARALTPLLLRDIKDAEQRRWRV